MSRAILFLFCLLSSILAKAQLDVELDIDLSTFGDYQGTLYWPETPDDGESRVVIKGYPYAPYVRGSAIASTLDSSKGPG